MKTAIDLFCGSGAVTWGLKDAGFNVIGAIDFDSTACATYRLNHPEVHLVEQDIKKVTPTIFSQTLDDVHVDLLVVCAPCQPFSNRNRKKSTDDDRLLLVLESLRFIEFLNPTILFFENVPNIGKSSAFYELEQRLIKLGYYVNPPQCVDAAELGVPQRRKRMILVGAKRNTLLQSVQDIKPYKKQTVFDAISDLPSPQICTPADDALHFARRHSALNIRRLQHIPHDGGCRESLPEDLQLSCHKKLAVKTNSFPDTYGRMKWDDVAPTLTTGCTDITKGRYAHPVQDRAITLREAARLQTFPDNYMFEGNSAQIANQIGNAVPPRMMARIAESLFKALSEEKMP
ncbi:MAG TPA: DNA cytosine methyltransferase [Negativicutes bacterium]|nr:DNA cytosine methyltransferase [Negativicutes bacterium]